MQIPNQPLLRARNWLTEAGGPMQREWHHRRWTSGRERVSVLQECLLFVKGDLQSLPKNQDPNWRKNWRWRVFELKLLDRLSAHVPFVVIPEWLEKPIWRDDEPLGYTKYLIPQRAIKTRYFALRVGPEGMFVCLHDEWSGLFRKPKLPDLGPWHEYRPLTEQEVHVLAAEHGWDITFA